MNDSTFQYGPFALTYGTGVVLEHTPTQCSVYFCPGDDSAQFLDQFEKMQDAAPDCPTAELLARLWEDYKP